MTDTVYITHSSAFMPFDPVPNEGMEEVLGRLGDRPSRARPIVSRSNGITSRHYVLDPATGQSRFTNAQITAEAVRGLAECGFDLNTMACLATGTSMADQLMPNHGVMVHGELGTPSCEVVTTAGICLAGATALKYAWMAVASGQVPNAVATGSEIASTLMHARNFQGESEHRVEALKLDPAVAFEKEFLRWMLSDGAGALLLERQPRPGHTALEIEWMDLFSQAHLLPACMYAGADRDLDGNLVGWMRMDQRERDLTSVFSVKQDVRLLKENVVKHTFLGPLQATILRRGLKSGAIDWFLPHLSSEYFREAVAQALDEAGLPLPQEKWFTNLTSRGNTGSASIYIMIDELLRSGLLKDGERILCFVPESGRFSSCLFQLRVVAP